MSDLASAFMKPDPVDAISVFITCFGRFWDVDRLVMRRLRSLAALEDEVGAVISLETNDGALDLRCLSAS